MSNNRMLLAHVVEYIARRRYAASRVRALRGFLVTVKACIGRVIHAGGAPVTVNLATVSPLRSSASSAATA